MINNNRQQQNGRRRGRGGQRQGGGNQGNGSRIDNRARGNAVQLLEKYKSLAADAQRQGDRVNTEYYLQFADHYFRVVSEQRGRFEEQQPRRDGQGNLDQSYDGDDDYDGDEQPGYGQQGAATQGGGEQRDSQGQPRGGRGYDRDGRDQPRRFDGERDDRGGNREPRRDPMPRTEAAAPPAEGVPALEGEPIAPSEQQARPRRPRTPRADAAPADTFDVDRLPPSFAPAPANDGGEAVDEAEAKPRRRRLRPAGEASQAS